MGVQGVGLEDHGDVAVLGGHVVHDLAVDEQLALADLLQAGHHAQGGGLAAAGGADQHDELLVRDLQIEVVDRRDAAIVDLFDALQTQSCHSDEP